MIVSKVLFPKLIKKKSFYQCFGAIVSFSAEYCGKATHWNVEIINQRHGRLQACREEHLYSFKKYIYAIVKNILVTLLSSSKFKSSFLKMFSDLTGKGNKNVVGDKRQNLWQGNIG